MCSSALVYLIHMLAAVYLIYTLAPVSHVVQQAPGLGCRIRQLYGRPIALIRTRQALTIMPVHFALKSAHYMVIESAARSI